MKRNYSRFLREYASSFKSKYIFVFIILFIQSITTMIMPLITSKIVDHALPQKNSSLFMWLILLMMLTYLIVLSLSVSKDYLLAKISEGLTFSLRSDINNKISNLPNSFFNENSLSNIISKYDKEVPIIKENCGYMLIETFGNLVKLMMIFIFMISININLTIISVITLIIYFINYSFWGKRLKVAAEENIKLNEISLEKLTENYNNSIVTKLYNGYEYSKRTFIDNYKKFYLNSIKLELDSSLNINTSAIILHLAGGVLWLIGGISTINGNMSIGEIMAMISYQSMLLGPVRFLSQFNNSYQRAIVSLDNIYEVLDYEEEYFGDEILNENIENIEFEKVSFSYDKENKILDNASLELNTNEITAIVGLSGSGKSTIAKLITGLYKVDSGNIYINSKDINNLEINSVRDKVTLITQDSLFFKDTIFKNLNLNNDKKISDIVSLSKVLDLYTHILDLPKNWNTLLSSGASNLSGGQRKRLDILRGLLKDSSVIIFDESTSSLDELRRNSVLDLMDTLKKDKIIIFISHNINDLVKADNVYVFSEHSILNIEDSTSDDLYTNTIKKGLAYV